MIPTTRLLKSRLENGLILVCPGAANALAARLIEEAGFETCYITGAGIANTYRPGTGSHEYHRTQQVAPEPVAFAVSSGYVGR